MISKALLIEGHRNVSTFQKLPWLCDCVCIYIHTHCMPFQQQPCLKSNNLHSKCVNHQIEEKYKNITVNDESPALRKKINELTLVRLNIPFYNMFLSFQNTWKRSVSLLIFLLIASSCLQDNQRLKQELMRSQTKVACLHSEMDSLKTELTDQSITSEQ